MPWKSGQSGNPSGRKRSDKGVITNLALEARQYGGLALKTIVEICKRGDTQSLRLTAAGMLLDRGFGRAQQHLEIDGSITLDLFATAGVDLDGAQMLRSALQASLTRDEELRALVAPPETSSSEAA